LSCDEEKSAQKRETKGNIKEKGENEQRSSWENANVRSCKAENDGEDLNKKTDPNKNEEPGRSVKDRRQSTRYSPSVTNTGDVDD